MRKMDEIVAKVRKEVSREPERYNLSLDRRTYEKFQERCEREGVAVSTRVEQFMRAYLASRKT